MKLVIASGKLILDCCFIVFLLLRAVSSIFCLSCTGNLVLWHQSVNFARSLTIVLFWKILARPPLDFMSCFVSLFIFSLTSVHQGHVFRTLGCSSTLGSKFVHWWSRPIVSLSPVEQCSHIILRIFPCLGPYLPVSMLYLWNCPSLLSGLLVSVVSMYLSGSKGYLIGI